MEATGTEVPRPIASFSDVSFSSCMLSRAFPSLLICAVVQREMEFVDRILLITCSN